MLLKLRESNCDRDYGQTPEAGDQASGVVVASYG